MNRSNGDTIITERGMMDEGCSMAAPIITIGGPLATALETRIRSPGLQSGPLQKRGAGWRCSGSPLLDPLFDAVLNRKIRGDTMRYLLVVRVACASRQTDRPKHVCNSDHGSEP
jgi:hypothetical protein